MQFMINRWPTIAALAATFAATAAASEAASVDSGRKLVQRNCSQCHAVGERGESPRAGAPAFRDLHTRYPVAMLAEALAEGILTGHPAMPEFKFTPREIEDVIAYLDAIQSRGSADHSPVPGAGRPS